MRRHPLWLEVLTLSTILGGFAVAGITIIFPWGGVIDSRGAAALMAAIFLLFGLVLLSVSSHSDHGQDGPG